MQFHLNHNASLFHWMEYEKPLHNTSIFHFNSYTSLFTPLDIEQETDRFSNDFIEYYALDAKYEQVNILDVEFRQHYFLLDWHTICLTLSKYKKYSLANLESIPRRTFKLNSNQKQSQCITMLTPYTCALTNFQERAWWHDEFCLLKAYRASE